MRITIGQGNSCEPDARTLEFIKYACEEAIKEHVQITEAPEECHLEEFDIDIIVTKSA